jgi:hypothetical protein
LYAAHRTAYIKAVKEAAMMTPTDMARAREILATVKPLAAEYYKLTGKPLGVTGEVGEMEVADLFGMKLASAREVGIDAWRGEESVQIKTRAKDPKFKSLGRMSRISVEKPCDTVMLVMLDIEKLNVTEVWEAPFSEVAEELGRPGSKARTRGQLSVSKFKTLAQRTWRKDAAA